MRVKLDPETHVYRTLDGWVELPSVTTIINATIRAGVLDRIPPEVLERKRQIGVVVHEAVRLEIQQALDEDHFQTQWPEAIGYLAAWRAFRAQAPWLHVTHTELSLGHAQHEFAGTLDMLGLDMSTDDLAPVLLDLKTGLHPGVEYQLSAYTELAINNDILTVPSWKVRRLVVELDPGGSYRATRIETNPVLDWRRFIAALTVYRAQQEIQRATALSA